MRYRRDANPHDQKSSIKHQFSHQGVPMTSERDREIKRRRQRRDKVRKLRARLERTTDVRQRAVVIRKIQRVSPTAPVPES
jgi:hypothetical protein